MKYLIFILTLLTLVLGCSPPSADTNYTYPAPNTPIAPGYRPISNTTSSNSGSKVTFKVSETFTSDKEHEFLYRKVSNSCCDENIKYYFRFESSSLTIKGYEIAADIYTETTYNLSPKWSRQHLPDNKGILTTTSTRPQDEAVIPLQIFISDLADSLDINIDKIQIGNTSYYQKRPSSSKSKSKSRKFGVFREGDTVGTIRRKHGIKEDQFCKLNPDICKRTTDIPIGTKYRYE